MNYQIGNKLSQTKKKNMIKLKKDTTQLIKF
jgi:hypothetical protein